MVILSMLEWVVKSGVRLHHEIVMGNVRLLDLHVTGGLNVYQIT